MQIKQFKDLGIKRRSSGFTGDKIDIGSILNVPIIIHDFKIEDSKFGKEKGNGKCLYLQIELSGTKHVVFSGSGVLMDYIMQVGKGDFPFTATIVKKNKHFEFQ